MTDFYKPILGKVLGNTQGFAAKVIGPAMIRGNKQPNTSR